MTENVFKSLLNLSGRDDYTDITANSLLGLKLYKKDYLYEMFDVKSFTFNWKIDQNEEHTKLLDDVFIQKVIIDTEEGE